MPKKWSLLKPIRAILKMSEHDTRPETPRGRNPIRSKQYTGPKMLGEGNLEGYGKCPRSQMPKNKSPKGLEINQNGPGKMCIEMEKGR